MTDIKNHQIIQKAILEFWFNQIDHKQWFIKDSGFDSLVCGKFRGHVEKALNGDYDYWNSDFSSRLPLILLLDQMTRNVFRDTPAAFSGDERALWAALNAISEGQLDDETEAPKRSFLLMPLMHSENIGIQDRSIALFERYTGLETTAYARKHRDVIAQFGRFPHRNSILGRKQTSEEIEFLKEPGSRF